MKRTLLLALALATSLVGACASNQPAPTGLRGTLLLIGGGLDDDNKPVYNRLIELASANGPARIVIATAASADQAVNAMGKTESIHAYAPRIPIDVITRETPQAETVALIDAATAMFFTGGDQKRIVDRYRPNGVDTPEAAAMRRLLDRGGVIAGTSAGDAMMSDPMFHTGRSTEALGIRSTVTGNTDDDDPATKNTPTRPLGPQIGRGMGILPWAITDSHFFERNRVGRLVAAQEVAGKRLGIGVGEDACVEVDLSTGMLTGISVADSLLVDTGSLQRDGLMRRNVAAKVIRQGTRVSLTDLLASAPPPIVAAPTGPLTTISVIEPGQNRQLASWRFFRRAGESGTGVSYLPLDDWALTGWPNGLGWAIFEAGPLTGP
ncbi:MAG: cyanophycinase [Phycisphaerales bacterium]|nr:cyanophycinase [Phycisphaerales bacterium]